MDSSKYFESRIEISHEGIFIDLASVKRNRLLYEFADCHAHRIFDCHLHELLDHTRRELLRVTKLQINTPISYPVMIEMPNLKQEEG